MFSKVTNNPYKRTRIIDSGLGPDYFGWVLISDHHYNLLSRAFFKDLSIPKKIMYKFLLSPSILDSKIYAQIPR